MTIELQVALIGLGGALIGGLLSVVSTWLIQRIERKKYRRDRSWELRREAYTTIVGSLERGRAILQVIDEGYREDPHGYDEGDHVKQASREMSEHLQAARFAYHAQRLLLSPRFIARFEQYLKDMRDTDSPGLAPPEQAADAAAVVARAVPDLEAIALEELGLAF